MSQEHKYYVKVTDEGVGRFSIMETKYGSDSVVSYNHRFNSYAPLMTVGEIIKIISTFKGEKPIEELNRIWNIKYEKNSGDGLDVSEFEEIDVPKFSIMDFGDYKKIVDSKTGKPAFETSIREIVFENEKYIFATLNTGFFIVFDKSKGEFANKFTNKDEIVFDYRNVTSSGKSVFFIHSRGDKKENFVIDENINQIASSGVQYNQSVKKFEGNDYKLIGFSFSGNKKARLFDVNGKEFGSGMKFEVFYHFENKNIVLGYIEEYKSESGIAFINILTGENVFCKEVETYGSIELPDGKGFYIVDKSGKLEIFNSDTKKQATIDMKEYMTDGILGKVYIYFMPNTGYKVSLRTGKTPEFDLKGKAIGNKDTGIPEGYEVVRNNTMRNSSGKEYSLFILGDKEGNKILLHRQDKKVIDLTFDKIQTIEILSNLPGNKNVFISVESYGQTFVVEIDENTGTKIVAKSKFPVRRVYTSREYGKDDKAYGVFRVENFNRNDQDLRYEEYMQSVK